MADTYHKRSFFFWPESIWQWLFVVIIVVQAAAVLGFEGWALYAFQQGLVPGATTDPNLPNTTGSTDDDNQVITNFVPYTRSLPTFLALYIFGMVYQAGLAWDALRLKNTIQIIGICVFNVVLVLYGALQEVQIKDTIFRITPVLSTAESSEDLENQMQRNVIAVPIILAVFSILLGFVGYKLYLEFAWTIYKHVSADLRMRRRYMIFEIYIALLKFDFFFFLAFTMEFLVLLSSVQQDGEFYLTIIAVPVTVFILIAAAVIVRKENRPLMWLVLAFYVIGLAYFFFKLLRIWIPSSHQSTYSPASRPLTVIAVLTIALLFLTIGVAIRCLLNFGQGLRPFVDSKRKPVPQEDDKMYMNDLPNLVQHPKGSAADPLDNRMVIE